MCLLTQSWSPDDDDGDDDIEEGKRGDEWQGDTKERRKEEK